MASAPALPDPAGQDDVAVWSALRRGEHEALATLYDRHARSVYNVAFRRAASWSTAEDVVQATFTNVWRRAVRGDLPPLLSADARPYLLGVAVREAANTGRAATRFRALLRRARPELPVPDPAGDVADRVDDERLMRRVRREVDALPRGQRDVVELVCWAGLSVAEAAGALHVAEGTVKSRLSRARAVLSRRLTEPQETP